MTTSKVCKPFKIIPHPRQQMVASHHPLNPPRVQDRYTPSFSAHIPKRCFESLSGKGPYPMPLPPPGVKKFTGLAADVYDYLNGTIPESEVSFYYGAIKNNEALKDNHTALVIGCGTGELLLALAEKGMKMEGMDPSEQMLRLCRYKARQKQTRVALHPLFMENFRLETRYDSILVPGETFMYILNLHTAQDTLKNIWNHLKPGGQLLIDLLFPSVDCLDEMVGTHTSTLTYENNGNQISCKTKREWNAFLQQREEHQRIELLNNEILLESQENHLRMRLYSANEFKQKLQDAGFVHIKSLRCVSLPHQDDKITFLAKKPLKES